MTHEAEHAAPRPAEQCGDGFSHQLQPLEPLDVLRCGTVSEMLARMSKTAFGGRSLGEAADVLLEMVQDPKCFVVGTFSGAMTVAKMGLLIAEMIDQGMLNAVVTTGALMCHGLIEQTGHLHFRYDPSWDDDQLYEHGYARVYDTLELEKSFDEIEHDVSDVLQSLAPQPIFGSHELCHRLGDYLRQKYRARGILQSAAAHNVPVYVPALTDSEIGIDIYGFNLMAASRGGIAVRWDPLRDMEDYYARMMAAERVGIFTIGGGVPRNWAQQIGPLAESLHRRTGGAHGGMVRFRYAVRVCPEPTHWGGLSGCTYSEGVSWGKFIPPAEGGRFAEVYADATIAWPVLLRAVLERMGRA